MAQGVIHAQWLEFGQAWWEAEAACQNLAHDNPGLKAQVEAALADMSEAYKGLSEMTQANLDAFARDPTSPQVCEQQHSCGVC